MPTTSKPDATPALTDVLDQVFAAGHALAAVAVEVAARRPHERVDPPLDSPDVMRAWQRYLTASLTARKAVEAHGHLLPDAGTAGQLFELLTFGVSTGANEYDADEMLDHARRMCGRSAALRRVAGWEERRVVGMASRETVEGAAVARPIAHPQPKGKNVDQKLAQALAADPDRYGWSGQKLADLIGVSASTVIGSKTWREKVKPARGALLAEQVKPDRRRRCKKPSDRAVG